MLRFHVRLCLMVPAVGLALVAVYAAGQTSMVLPQQKPRQPYTAEFKTTTVRTLANGTTITRESTEIHALDRDGRSFVSTKELPTSADRPAVTRANAHDPVEGTDSNWDSGRSKATIVKLPPADQHQGCWATDSGRRWQFGSVPQRATALKNIAPAPVARPKPVNEDLGTTTIEGVEAHGTRITWTTPAGEIGNDAPLVRTEETWWATGIGLQLREVNDDPQTGKRTREIVSLSLTDPDPALFQPPEGYEVVTETAHPVACE
jgi:hypothetical protein